MALNIMRWLAFDLCNMKKNIKEPEGDRTDVKATSEAGGGSQVSGGGYTAPRSLAAVDAMKY